MFKMTEAERVPVLRLAAIVSLSFGLTLLTSTLEPALIGNRVIAFVGVEGGRTTIYGWITFGGLLVASVTQPVVGALSDHARARSPFIVVGAVIVIVGLVVIALSPSLFILVAGLLLLQLGNNTALASWQPLIATDVPEAKRCSICWARLLDG